MDPHDSSDDEVDALLRGIAEDETLETDALAEETAALLAIDRRFARPASPPAAEFVFIAAGVNPARAARPASPPARRPMRPAAVHLADDPEGEAEDDEQEALVLAARRRFRRGVRADALDREAEGVVPTDGESWCCGAHGLYESRLLTIDDPRSPNPPGFKGELYAPQATLLSAMLELERRPFLRVADGKLDPDWAPRIQSKYGRISERFSFGKTVLSLALVCAQRVPARLPEVTPLATYPLSGSAARVMNRACVLTAEGSACNYDPVGSGFLPEIAVRYKRFLPLTIVAAAASVISQWEDNARRFTDLRYFIVENVRSLREFEEMFRLGQLADYDLLFVKAGRVTTSFAVAGEPAVVKKSKSRSLFEALARVLDGVPVARLIIDDFDTLKLGSDDCFVPALFTWLVSATRRQTSAKAAVRTARTVEEYMRENMSLSFPILGAALDDILNKVFSLHCAPAYVDAHISSTAIGFRRVFVRGGLAAAILRDLEVPEEIVEMVNADAVGTAATNLGLTASSVADVIHRIVGNHLDKLRHAVRARTRAARARDALALRGPPEKDREKIKDLRAALKDGDDGEAAAALRAVSGGGKDVNESLASLEAWAAEQEEKHGKTLARMRDNIREGHCQCCMIPFEAGACASADAEAAYVLAGCCQIIVCEPCITKKEGVMKVFIKRCPNCARDVRLPAGLVRVGPELDLEAALKDETVVGAAPEPPPPNPEPEAVPEPPADPAAPAAADPVAQIDNPKLKALVQLVTGRPIDCLRDEAAPPYVEGLLHGRRNIPWPADKPKKFLVFTMHAESTRLLDDTLTRLGIAHCVLRGLRAQKDEAVRMVREGEANILLVTAPKDCGGLDLPFLSHVVFYHRILDRNVEAQVAARGQRLGREHNLEVLAIINEAEVAGLPQ